MTEEREEALTHLVVRADAAIRAAGLDPTSLRREEKTERVTWTRSLAGAGRYMQITLPPRLARPNEEYPEDVRDCYGLLFGQYRTETSTDAVEETDARRVVSFEAALVCLVGWLVDWVWLQELDERLAAS